MPGLGGDFGNTVLGDHARHWLGSERGGLVLTLLDVWVLDSNLMGQFNTACWVPVDHAPVPPAVKGFFLNSGAIPIAMSEFGQEQLQDFDPLYVPHGVDLKTFKPHPRDEVREKTGVDKDAFLVGMVAANKGRPSRKSFQQSLEAFAIFREHHDNAVLYLHTIINPNHNNGEDLISLIASLEIPEDAIRICDQYRATLNPMPPETMAQVYSCFDVLLNPSQGEGFGIPVLEAQACGVPAVVTDFSAMSEVCGAGWKVGGRPYWTGQKSWQMTPNVGEIIGALEECYTLTDEKRRKLSEAARRHAGRYGVDLVMERHWLPALEEIEERIGNVPELVAA